MCDTLSRMWGRVCVSTLVLAAIMTEVLGAGVAAASPAADPEASRADYEDANWMAAHEENYTAADRPESTKIDRVIIHVTEGSYASTQHWFKDPESSVTTHYVIRSADGEVTQMVSESDIAWHAGNWKMNQRSIGIEHEGYVDKPQQYFTEEMYESSARLVRAICDRYGIPLDRDHILGHNEVPGADHTDPGSGWDWDHYMDLVRGPEDAGGGEPVVIDDDAAEASSQWSSATAEDQQGDDYLEADPAKRSDPLWYDSPRDTAGRYRVEVRYPAAADHHERTPYLVSTADGLQARNVDQTTGGGQWRSLGEFDLAAGTGPAVGVSRWAPGEGKVVADAVRMTKIG